MRGPADTPGARLRPSLATALRRSAGLAAALVAAAATALAAQASDAVTPGSLRAQADILKARAAVTASAERTALLDLYSLEADLGRARASLASLTAQLASLSRQEAEVRHRLVIARDAVTKSQAALGRELRSLYERGEPNAVAVLLGSESLDAALDQLDSIDRSARDHRRIIAQTLRARREARSLAAALSSRQAALRRVQRSKVAAVQRLAHAHDSRAAYLHALRVRRHLAAARIAALESEAAAAERKSRELAAQAAAREQARVAAAAAAARTKAAAAQRAASTGDAASRAAPARPAPSTGAADSPAAATPGDGAVRDGGGSLPADGASAAASAAPGERALTVSITAYTLRGHTATGLPTGWGIVAVDPNVIPLGTKMTVPGYGEAIAADTGPGVRGAAIDVWVPDNAAASAFGRRTVTIVLH